METIKIFSSHDDKGNRVSIHYSEDSNMVMCQTFGNVPVKEFIKCAAEFEEYLAVQQEKCLDLTKAIEERGKK